MKKNCIINDYVVDGIKDPENKIKRIFVIYFERNKQKYFLRNLSDTTCDNSVFIYMKITKPRRLGSTKQYISMLQVVFSVNVIESSLNISIVKNLKSDDKLTFSFEPKDSPISIGRGDCTIKLAHPSLSKLHCSIIFNKSSKCWEIRDGYGDRNSTNGTWLMINSKHEIDDETFVKIGNNTFRISVT